MFDKYLFKEHLSDGMYTLLACELVFIKYHKYVSIFSDSQAVSQVKLEAILQDHEGVSAHGCSTQQTFDKGKRGTFHVLILSRFFLNEYLFFHHV